MKKPACPACGEEMARAIQDLHYICKGKPLVVPALVCAMAQPPAPHIRCKPE